MSLHLAVTSYLITLQTILSTLSMAQSLCNSAQAAHPLACSFSRMDSASTAMQDTIS